MAPSASPTVARQSMVPVLSPCRPGQAECDLPIQSMSCTPSHPTQTAVAQSTPPPRQSTKIDPASLAPSTPPRQPIQAAPARAPATPKLKSGWFQDL
jgi:hypothetical protein